MLKGSLLGDAVDPEHLRHRRSPQNLPPHVLWHRLNLRLCELTVHHAVHEVLEDGPGPWVLHKLVNLESHVPSVPGVEEEDSPQPVALKGRQVGVVP